MPLSLRIPSEKENMIKKAASRAGKTKTAFILEAVYEKLGLIKSREEMIREMSGWLPRKEAEQLRKAVGVFGKVDEEDWH
ncbi:MAG: DUF1778 domain-containing protein [Deltaproteobacteria bacterium]|nr:DUF1778 domain-containing protein [Deltaproteobacteria bacterium]